MGIKTFEEYRLGEQFVSYARTITEADIVNFTCLAGLKVPAFIDEEYCKEHSIFGTRVAPGLLTASIAAGMLDDILGKYTLAALGLNEFVFSQPVRIGDTIHARITIEGLRDNRDQTRGVMTTKVEVVNQEDAVPCVFHATFLMRKGDL